MDTEAPEKPVSFYKDMRPVSTKEDAAIHAEKINSYWAKRGMWANARISPVRINGIIASYTVISDMINGYPRERFYKGAA